MKIIFQALAILFLTALQADGANNMETFWNKGVRFYKEKEYDSAAVYFEKIASLKPKNAEVYYNLGNTYYRLNKVGMAILNYQRALHIDPGYTFAKENLQLAENRMSNHVAVAKEVFFLEWWEALIAPDMATLWAILAFIVFSATMLIIFLKGVSKIIINIPTQVPVLLGFVWVCLLVLAFFSASKSENSGMAVVMQNDAPLLCSDLKGKPLSLLPEGTTVKVKTTKGEYIEVVIPDGRKGFILQTWLTKI